MQQQISEIKNDYLRRAAIISWILLVIIVCLLEITKDAIVLVALLVYEYGRNSHEKFSAFMISLNEIW